MPTGISMCSSRMLWCKQWLIFSLGVDSHGRLPERALPVKFKLPQQNIDNPYFWIGSSLEITVTSHVHGRCVPYTLEVCSCKSPWSYQELKGSGLSRMRETRAPRITILVEEKPGFHRFWADYMLVYCQAFSNVLEWYVFQFCWRRSLFQAHLRVEGAWWLLTSEVSFFCKIPIINLSALLTCQNHHGHK